MYLLFFNGKIRTATLYKCEPTLRNIELKTELETISGERTNHLKTILP